MKHSGQVLKNPRITEKATLLVPTRAYTFDVAIGATKKDIAHAVKTLYKVTPLRVRTLSIPTSKTSPKGRNGKVGTTGGGKKAYVYLKKGDKIEVL